MLVYASFSYVGTKFPKQLVRSATTWILEDFVKLFLRVGKESELASCPSRTCHGAGSRSR
jgi:hypothetical protein